MWKKGHSVKAFWMHGTNKQRERSTRSFYCIFLQQQNWLSQIRLSTSCWSVCGKIWRLNRYVGSRRSTRTRCSSFSQGCLMGAAKSKFLHTRLSQAHNYVHCLLCALADLALMLELKRDFPQPFPESDTCMFWDSCVARMNYFKVYASIHFADVMCDDYKIVFNKPKYI